MSVKLPMGKLTNMSTSKGSTTPKDGHFGAPDQSSGHDSPSLILTHDHIKKLGLDIKDLGVGDVLHMHAHGRVTHVSSDQNHSKGPGEPKQRQRVELSLHKAAVHNPKLTHGESDSEKSENAKKGARAAMEAALEGKRGDRTATDNSDEA